jgi:hypothetical protein
MPLTLGFLASVLILLPGLVALAAFNFRVGRAGARRPEQQLTAINAIVVAVIISVMTHYLGWLVSEGAIDAAVAIHDAFPTIHWGEAPANPLVTVYNVLTGGKPVPAGEVVAPAALLALEIFAILGFLASDSFDLFLERLDWSGQGWVFQHITRPAENGYAPIGHVFTSTMSCSYGVAYKGVVIDTRQGANGEVLSIALARPERFLYEIGHSEGRPAGGDQATGVTTHAKDYVGGVVQLDSRIITNIVVHSIAQSLLEEIVPDEEQEEPIS